MDSSVGGAVPPLPHDGSCDLASTPNSSDFVPPSLFGAGISTSTSASSNTGSGATVLDQFFPSSSSTFSLPPGPDGKSSIGTFALGKANSGSSRSKSRSKKLSSSLSDLLPAAKVDGSGQPGFSTSSVSSAPAAPFKFGASSAFSFPWGAESFGNNLQGSTNIAATMSKPLGLAKFNYLEDCMVEILTQGSWYPFKIIKVNTSNVIMPTYDVLSTTNSEVLKSVPCERIRLPPKFKERETVFANYLKEGVWKPGKITAVHFDRVGSETVCFYDISYDNDIDSGFEARVPEATIRPPPSFQADDIVEAIPITHNVKWQGWQEGRIKSLAYRDRSCSWVYDIEYYSELPLVTHFGDENSEVVGCERDALVSEDRLRLKAVYAQGIEVEVEFEEGKWSYARVVQVKYVDHNNRPKIVPSYYFKDPKPASSKTSSKPNPLQQPPMIKVSEDKIRFIPKHHEVDTVEVFHLDRWIRGTVGTVSSIVNSKYHEFDISFELPDKEFQYRRFAMSEIRSPSMCSVGDLIDVEVRIDSSEQQVKGLSALESGSNLLATASGSNPLTFPGFSVTWRAGKVKSIEYRVEESGCWYYGIEYDDHIDEKAEVKKTINDIEVVSEARLRRKASFKEGESVNIFIEDKRRWEGPHKISKVNYFADLIVRKPIVPTYDVCLDGKGWRSKIILTLSSNRIQLYNADANKSLLRAVEADDIDRFNAAIEASANVDYFNPHSGSDYNNLRSNDVESSVKSKAFQENFYGFYFSSIHIACLRGNLAVVSRLLELKANCTESTSNERCTPLYIASKKGYLSICEILIHYGALANQENEGSKGNEVFTPLLVATEEGHLPVCLLLLQNRVAVNLSAKNGRSPLFVASEKGHLQICELLITHGAAINQADSREQTPLYVASANGHLPVCESLINHGASVHQASRFREDTPLCVASESGHLAICELLIKHGAIVCIGHLYVASQKGHFEVCKLLMQYGAAVYQENYIYGTPLHVASEYLRLQVCELLLKHGANVNQTDESGCTPLRRACCTNSLLLKNPLEILPILEFLITHGAAVNQADKDGCSPLYAASGRGFLAVCERLIVYGAAIDQADNDGQTPLYIASKNCCLPVCKLLINHGASVDQAHQNGGTPLWILIKEMLSFRKTLNSDILSVCKSLINHGASVNQTDKDGRSLLYVASEKGHLPLCKLLIARGASVNYTRGHEIRTPLFAAMMSGHLPVCELLIQNGANANLVSETGQAYLSMASRSVKELLRWHISPTSATDCLLLAIVMLKNLWIYHHLDCSSIIDLFQMLKEPPIVRTFRRGT